MLLKRHNMKSIKFHFFFSFVDDENNLQDSLGTTSRTKERLITYETSKIIHSTQKTNAKSRVFRNFNNHQFKMLRSESRGRTASDRASQDVPVIPLDSERVENLSVAALLVLEQQVGMVKGGEFDKPEIVVFYQTPFGLHVPKLHKTRSSASGHDMDRPVKIALVRVFLVVRALILYQINEKKLKIISRKSFLVMFFLYMFFFTELILDSITNSAAKYIKKNTVNEMKI